MAHRSIISYYRKQTAVFNKNFPLVRNVQEMKAIHDLRVSCKRLNALYFFLEFLEPEKFNQKTNAKAYKNLFKSAGKIREFQLHQKIISKYEEILGINFTLFDEYLASSKNRHRQKFAAWVNNYKQPDWLRYEKRILSHLGRYDEGDLTSKGKQYIIDNLEMIRKYLKDPKEEESYHQIRILLKRIRFLLEISEKFCPESLKCGPTIATIKEGEVVLGDWHDRMITYNQFIEYRRKEGAILFPPQEDFDKLGQVIKMDKLELLADSLKVLKKVPAW